MDRLTTDNPCTNMETMLNYAYAENRVVKLRYADGEEDIDLTDYIARLAREKEACSDVTESDVMNGDACRECDCELAVLNAVAIQAAELRTKLKDYEDAEEQGRLVNRPPIELYQKIFLISHGEILELIICDAYYGLFRTELDWTICTFPSGRFGWNKEFGKSVFLSREAAEAKLREVQS